MKVKDLHQQAETLREQDKLLDALKLYEQVVLEYQKTKNYSGLVEALGGRCLTYKHLFLLTNDYSFFNLANHSALSSLEIAKNFNLKEKFHRCYFRLGEMQMLISKFTKATKYYQKALDLYPQEEAEKGDFQYHLGEALYQDGNIIDGLKNLHDGQELIEKYKSSTDSFVYHVWLSGCLMRQAELTRDKKCLNRAEQIINSDPRLIIRKRQLEEMKKHLFK